MKLHQVWLAAMFVALAGCPPSGGWPTPPFDASGKFLGTWRGQTTADSDKPQEIKSCVLELTLTQDAASAWPHSFAVKGTALVNYDCLDLPEWAGTPPPSTVKIGGVVEQNGRLHLLSGACGTAMCATLNLDGLGEDVDGDGKMDRYDGDWAFSLLLAGFTPFTVTGTFGTDVAPAEG